MLSAENREAVFARKDESFHARAITSCFQLMSTHYEFGWLKAGCRTSSSQTITMKLNNVLEEVHIYYLYLMSNRCFIDMFSGSEANVQLIIAVTCYNLLLFTLRSPLLAGFNGISHSASPVVTFMMFRCVD